MKNVIFMLLLLCIAIPSGNNSVKAYTSKKVLPETQQYVVQSLENNITIIRSITTLKRGDMGLITIQGKPGERYTIETTYNVGGRTIPVRQWRSADSQGMASFSWVVGSDTDSGTYNATIYGGGASLNLTHTVIS